jgi:hypothetical protein
MKSQHQMIGQDGKGMMFANGGQHQMMDQDGK